MKSGDLGCHLVDTHPDRAASGRQEVVRRVLAAVLFVPVFYLLMRYLPPVAFFGLVTLAGLLAVGEFYRLFSPEGPWPLGLAFGCVATTLLFFSAQWPALISDRTVLLLTVMIASSLPLASPLDLRRAVVQSSILMTGVLYIGLTLSCLLFTRALPEGEFLIFFVVSVTWAGDTGAYLAGKMFGRHPLAPTISPKKTFEGVAGGVVLALAFALASRFWFLPSFSITDCILLGLLLTGVGVLGDLTESAMKRSVAAKDSGALIPGHGGMLDRLDSLLFTAPCFYYYVSLVKGA